MRPHRAIPRDDRGLPGPVLVPIRITTHSTEGNVQGTDEIGLWTGRGQGDCRHIIGVQRNVRLVGHTIPLVGDVHIVREPGNGACIPGPVVIGSCAIQRPAALGPGRGPGPVLVFELVIANNIE